MITIQVSTCITHRTIHTDVNEVQPITFNVEMTFVALTLVNKQKDHHAFPNLCHVPLSRLTNTPSSLICAGYQLCYYPPCSLLYIYIQPWSAWMILNRASFTNIIFVRYPCHCTWRGTPLSFLFSIPLCRSWFICPTVTGHFGCFEYYKLFIHNITI